MLRNRILCLVALLTLATACFAQPDLSKVELRVTKVAGTVYMLDAAKGNAGGNIAASVGEDGIVLVDDQYAPLADKIRAALRSVTDKPIRFVINTHYHGDHTGGNALFQKDAPILAQDNVRKRLQRSPIRRVGRTAGGWACPAAGRPARS